MVEFPGSLLGSAQGLMMLRKQDGVYLILFLFRFFHS